MKQAEIKLDLGSGSHLPVLSLLLYKTSGPVLELGVGLYSTPILHWICTTIERPLVSFENNKKYFDLFSELQNDTHKINYVSDWDQADIEKPWALAFVDHKPTNRRIVEISRLAPHARLIVAHDADMDKDWRYKYESVYPMFKHRCLFDRVTPATVILSNFGIEGLIWKKT